MFKITGICDKCKKEVVQNSQYFDLNVDEWQEVLIQISTYESKRFHFCKKCRGELGLIRESGAKPVKCEAVEEKLLSLICEIVAGELDNRN